MFKSVIYFTIISLFVGCMPNHKNNVSKQENYKVANKLNGIWCLSNYFDNILLDKQIAKHRLQRASWFAILLKIEKDSLKGFGSITGLKEKINFESDTLLSIGSYGSEYTLSKVDDELHLKQISNEDFSDTVTYVYRKRNDLKTLLENQDSIYNIIEGKNQKDYTISQSITRYFNEKLISGTYKNKLTNRKILFKTNGDLINFKNFDKYRVRNYFGTLHPHKNLDVITLINSVEDTSKQFNWKFENNKLILTEFVSEMIEYKGEKHVGDDYVLGKKRIELIKQ